MAALVQRSGYRATESCTLGLRVTAMVSQARERKGLVTVRAEQDRIVTSRDAVAIFGDRGRIIGIRSIR